MTIRYNIEIEIPDSLQDLPSDGDIRRAVAAAVPENDGVSVSAISGCTDDRETRAQAHSL